MGKRGPSIHINWDQFDDLVSFQCTQEEVAAFFDCDVDTLNNCLVRDRGVTISEIWNKRKFAGRVRLRKAQFAIAEGKGPGAATMAIYLDKKMFPEETPRDPPPLAQQPQFVVPMVAKTFREFCETAAYKPPYPEQETWQAYAFENTVPRLLLGSRGYGKTEYLTIIGVAFQIYLDWFKKKLDPAHQMDETNLILTKSKARNRALVAEIADALSRNGVPLERQNSSEIKVQGLVSKDLSVEALTIRSSIRGRHPKRVLMDDPVTDEDVSAATREQVNKKWEEVLKLTSNVLIIGQPAHVADLYAKLRNVILTKLVPHGTIPELDHDLTLQRTAGVSEESIKASYFLTIESNLTMPFSNIKAIDALPTGTKVAFLDPADGKDFTALSIFRAYGEGIAVEGYAWQRPWFHALEEIAKHLKENNVARLCVEINKHGLILVEQLQKVLKPSGIGVTAVHSDSNKHADIMSAGSLAHMIHLSARSDKVYTDQVRNYEEGAKFDDCPDSLARGLIWLGLIRKRK